MMITRPEIKVLDYRLCWHVVSVRLEKILFEGLGFLTSTCVVDVCADSVKAVVRLGFDRGQLLLDGDQRVANLLHSLFHRVRIVLFKDQRDTLRIKINRVIKQT